MNWTILLDTSVIFYSVGVFAGLIVLLTITLLFVKSKLTPAGDVKIIINGEDEKPVLTSPGASLLSTLSQKHIFLPSACGGGGTCAMCKCQVLEGGGDILPTEEGYFTRKQVQENWRLACQVKVRGDMKIKVPDEIFGIKKWECEVVSNHNVATYIKEFVVRLPEGEKLHFK
jgi:Na+-transporting NADH:ubiquinone oxidoreductase subunit F